MLPKKSCFEKYVNLNGIQKNDLIVIYDQIGFFCSARVWFTFKYFGFENIKILEQGYDGWIKNNHKTSNQKTTKKKVKNKINEKKELIIKKKTIGKNLKKNNIVIFDARSKKRFLGIEKEPRKIQSPEIFWKYKFTLHLLIK